MQYHRYGHAKEHFVKLGEKVKKGQKILSIGTGNGQWSAHCHKDSPTQKLSSWEAYVFGMTKEQVAKLYAPITKEEIKIMMPDYDHMGFGYLEHANYGTEQKPKWCYHPGVDLNGKGAGNADIGVSIYSPCDGVVVHDDDDGKASNGGWGKLLVIQETIPEPKQDEVIPIPVTVTEEKPNSLDGYINPNGQTIKTESEVVPVDWKFIIEKIINLIKLIFKK
jgi:hypothetical protein